MTKSESQGNNPFLEEEPQVQTFSFLNKNTPVETSLTQ